MKARTIESRKPESWLTLMEFSDKLLAVARLSESGIQREITRLGESDEGLFG